MIKIEEVKSVDYNFLYLVHGVVQEFLPHTAFRCAKHFDTEKKKIIKCPHCRKTFTTVNESEKVELYCHPKKMAAAYHKTIPCKTCRNVVGVVFASYSTPA